MHWGLIVAACSVLLLGAPAAQADVVFHMSEPCPPGSEEVVDHCGPWCKATQCSSDDACKPVQGPTSDKKVKRSCRQAGLCVENDTYESCSGWGMGKPLQRQIARGPCQTDADCRRPSTCRIEKRCVTPVAAGSSKPSGTGAPRAAPGGSDADPPKSSCTCTWVGAASPGAPWLALLCLPVVLTASRRRRR